MTNHLILSLLALVVGPALIYCLDRNEAVANIHKYLDTFSKSNGKALCDQYQCCTVGSNEKCSIDQFKVDESILVLPGGSTRCIFDTSTPYGFQVIRGSSDKLLIYFQGGGACWDKTSTNEGLCTTDISPQSLVGIFDRTNPNNKFKDYTIVQGLYCSGDLW